MTIKFAKREVNDEDIPKMSMAKDDLPPALPLIECPMHKVVTIDGDLCDICEHTMTACSGFFTWHFVHLHDHMFQWQAHFPCKAAGEESAL